MTKERTSQSQSELHLCTRVSTGRQARYGLSEDEQQERGIRFARERGLTVVGPYTMRGISGKTRLDKRRDLLDVIEKAKPGDIVFFAAVDRNGRAPEVIWDFYLRLEAKGVGLVYDEREDDDDDDGLIDCTTEEGRIRLSRKVTQAAEERQKISRRSRRIHKYLADQGVQAGGKIAFGFTATNVVSDTEAAVCRHIADLAEAGWTTRQIAVEVGQPRHIVTGVLTKPRYAAYRKTGDGRLVEVTAYEPIIPRDQWVRLQADRSRRRRDATKGKRGRVAPLHLFSGNGPSLMHAHDDGTVWRMEPSSQRDRYRCKSKNDRGAHTCPMRLDPTRDLVDSMAGHLILLEALDLPATVEHYIEQSAQTVTALDALLREADRAVEIAEQRVTVGLRKLMDDVIDDDDYKALKDDLEMLQHQRDDLRDRRRSVETVQVASDAAETAVAYLRKLQDDIRTGVAADDDVDRLRIVASRVIDHVRIHPQADALVTIEGVGDVIDGGMSAGDFSVEIVWRHDAILSAPNARIEDDMIVGSVYPEIARQPLSIAATRTSSGNSQHASGELTRLLIAELAREVGD